MSTQQDIYAAGSESRPPMLNKENYVPWSSRLLRYAKNDELSNKELKQIEADGQAIQTILLGLPEDIYAAYNQKEVDEFKAKRLAKTQDPLTLMANSNNPYVFPTPHQDQSSFNQNYLQQPMQNPEDITDPTTVMNMALTLIAKAFNLNYSTPTNNNQRISSNLMNRQIAQPGQNAENPAGYNDVIRNQIRNGNLVAARAEGNAAGKNRNQIRCYNCREVGHYTRNCTVRPRRKDAAYLQTQLLIAQKEEAKIQLQAEEYNLVATAADLDEIEEVNANCILMANLQQASTSGTQTDSALVYDTDGSAEEKSTVSFLLEEKKRLKSDFKTCKDKLLDKQIQLEKRIKDLNNIVLKTGQSIQTIHMLSPKPNSFYHTEQKMALGYQNLFYLKQAQKKQQSLYDGKVLHEKHDSPVVHDSEETLQLAQESREKMKQMNKEIKPANYTKINHLSGVFVP
nr:hypothetical protein [Tanacetum cinerariifolium]